MTRSTGTWTTGIAVAALVVLPAAGMAQTSGTAEPPQTSSTAPAAQQAGDQASAQEHLRKAEDSLNKIEPSSVTGQTKSRVNELKQHLNKLQRAVAANDRASATGAGSRSPMATSGARGTVNWQSEVAAIDRLLTQILGPDPAAGTTGTTGTTGTAGSTTGAASVDPAIRTQLMEVRAHITAFAAAMSGKAPDPTASSATSSSTTTSSTGTSGTTSTTGTSSMTGTTGTSGTGGTATQPPTSSTSASSATGTQPPASSGVDQESARQHLTAARNALSEMTQLPAASQLTGDARTQVSQLIGNFNELITTTAEWRSSYAKLQANLTALIGAETTDESAARTSGTAGAVGTSGSVGIDPAIRAKLIEFRAHLEKFEQAAGGSAAGTASATMAAGATTGATTSGTSTSSTGTSTMTSSGQTTTGQTTSPSTQPGMDKDKEELLRHIAAIEAIIGPAPSGTSGTAGTTGTAGTGAASTATLTLTASQVEQLRTHLDELRRLVNQR